MWDYNINKLKRAIHNLRLSFLKRKNINNWKRLPKETPECLSKIINSFERKINNLEIFDSKTKKLYFQKLNELYEEYYEGEKENKCSKIYAYANYYATNYCPLKKHTKKQVEELKKRILTFKEFKKSGLVNKYKI